MKPVFLKFTDGEGNVTKTFTTCSLKTGVVDLIFDIAQKADNMEKSDSDLNEAKEFFNDLKALIIRIFNYQFNLEELNENVEQDELMNVFKDISNKIGGSMKKN